MARQKRNIKNDRYYHLVNRGVAKQVTFLDSYDYNEYIRLLVKSYRKYPLDIIAFVLMPNHYHLLIRALDRENVSRCMHWVNGMYARYFNDRYERTGHLWQNRFYSKEIRDGRQLGNTWMYVDQNPLRASMVNNPTDWKWSSAYLRKYGDYLHFLSEPNWWGKPTASKWWSKDELDAEALEKVRSSLKRKGLDKASMWE
ncbi:MAG: transposase [Planctomycetes bacterium]|nr:transposase [Planctomycetota bacterium]